MALIILLFFSLSLMMLFIILLFLVIGSLIGKIILQIYFIYICAFDNCLYGKLFDFLFLFVGPLTHFYILSYLIVLSYLKSSLLT